MQILIKAGIWEHGFTLSIKLIDIFEMSSDTALEKD